MNGFEYSLWEIDEALRQMGPDLARRDCTPRVMEEANQLLDQRNELIAIMADLAMEELLDGTV